MAAENFPLLFPGLTDYKADKIWETPPVQNPTRLVCCINLYLITQALGTRGPVFASGAVAGPVLSRWKTPETQIAFSWPVIELPQGPLNINVVNTSDDELRRGLYKAVQFAHQPHRLRVLGNMGFREIEHVILVWVDALPPAWQNYITPPVGGDWTPSWAYIHQMLALPRRIEMITLSHYPVPPYYLGGIPYTVRPVVPEPGNVTFTYTMDQESLRVAQAHPPVVRGYIHYVAGNFPAGDRSHPRPPPTALPPSTDLARHTPARQDPPTANVPTMSGVGRGAGLPNATPALPPRAHLPQVIGFPPPAVSHVHAHPVHTQSPPGFSAAPETTPTPATPSSRPRIRRPRPNLARSRPQQAGDSNGRVIQDRSQPPQPSVALPATTTPLRTPPQVNNHSAPVPATDKVNMGLPNAPPTATPNSNQEGSSCSSSAAIVAGSHSEPGSATPSLGLSLVDWDTHRYSPPSNGSGVESFYDASSYQADQGDVGEDGDERERVVGREKGEKRSYSLEGRNRYEEKRNGGSEHYGGATVRESANKKRRL